MKPHDEQFSIYIKTQFYKSKYYINFHKSNLDIISSLNNTYLGFRKKIENNRNNIYTTEILLKAIIFCGT